MVTLLHIVSYGAAAAVFVFVTLSLASGLLWLAEVIEEHSRTAKIVGKRTVYAVITFHVLLYFLEPNLPLALVLFSICCHFVYLMNFRKFPVISLTSWHFIASCVLVVADHFLWFFYFHGVTEAAKRRERRWRHPMEPIPHVPTFLDIATFFGICIWLVPLFLFLSLTANDNALPTTRREPTTPVTGNFDDPYSLRKKVQRSSLFVTLSSRAMSLLPTRVSRGRTQINADGIIAPRLISRSPSPLQSRPTLLSPNFQRRSTSPAVLLQSSMSPGSVETDAASFASINSGTESWIPIDGGSRPPSRTSTPGALDNLTNDSTGTRRRVNLLPPAQIITR